MGYHAWQDEKAHVVKRWGVALNDRARLQHAFEITLEKLGVDELQIKRIVTDVKKAEFGSIKKLMRIEPPKE